MVLIYVVVSARTNLLMDDDYNNFVYATPRGEYRGGPGLSLNDYWVKCVNDKRFKPYFSKSHVVNAFQVSPTTLLYTAKPTARNLAAMRDLCVAHVTSWLDLLDEGGVMLEGIDTFDRQAELLRPDVRMRTFVARDPDTRNVVKIIGRDTTDKLVRTLYGDPDDGLWDGR